MHTNGCPTLLCLGCIRIHSAPFRQSPLKGNTSLAASCPCVFGLGDVSGIHTRCFVSRNEGQLVAGRSSSLQSRLALVKQKYYVCIQQEPPWGESATRHALGCALQREVCEADGAPVWLRRTGQANTSVHSGVDVPRYWQRDHQILGKAEILSQNMKHPQ